MRKILFFIFVICCYIQQAMAQKATFSVPVAIGRNNCGGSSGLDSVYYFNYNSPSMVNGAGPLYTGCKPVLKVNYAPLSGYSTANKPFTVFDASIAFNPKDQMIYYVWTDYNVPSPYKSYIWRWSPTACPTAAGGLDTIRTFKTDIGGITFDANGVAYQLEFLGPAPYKAFLRTVDFTTGAIGPRDTLDLTGGKQLWNVGSGDITLTPSGQMYFVFNNKLFTPDYGSYNGPTHHLKCTYIDTVKAPSGSTALPGLAFGSGDLIAAYSPSCVYRRVDGVTGDTAVLNYTYASNKGVKSNDMTQINSGLGVSKKLVSVSPTVVPNQYNVSYDIYVRNYGNVPISNVQVTDNLSLINPSGLVSNVVATLSSNPAGVSINPLYNGTTVTSLLQASQSLPCYPVADNNFTINISCTISGLLSGIVYNNSAIGTANGYKNAALKDSSTNGNNPDLNQNDKPDDLGESEPTPLVIILTPTTPPCATLAQTLYTQNFGAGTGLVASVTAGSVTASSAYTGVTTTPVGINRFTVTNNANNGNVNDWISLTDHTGNTNGRMLLVNADAPASVMYRDTVPAGCPGQQHSLSFWVAFIGNNNYQTVCDGLGGFKYPVLTVRVRDRITGLTITQFRTDTIKLTSWQQLGMKWVMPSGYTNVIIELLNAGAGGCGNDIAIDDITYGICDPVPSVSLDNPAGTCLGGSVTFTADVTDPAVIPGPKDYQWQWSPAPGTGPWTNILLANSLTYTINPVAAADTGKYYRVVMAAQGNIGVANCQYFSPAVRLAGVKPSTAPTSITAPSLTICNGSSVVLTANGASLGTGANYQWGTGAVVGTNPIGGATSNTLPVSPTTTSTYWVRVENTTSPCTSITDGVTVNVIVNDPSTAPANITGLDVCNGSPTTLTANGGVLGTGANYQWGTGTVPGTAPIAGATNPTLTISPTVNTTYWVRIQNTTAPCTANSAGVTKLVTVRQPSTAPTSITSPLVTICRGSSVVLTATGGTLGTSANYQWGTGAVIGTNPIAGAISNTLSVSPTSTTTYWVRVENTTAPCSAITGGVTTTITVNDPSTAPSSITGADICNGSSTTLTANGGVLGTGANYQWGTGPSVGTSPLAGETNSTLTVSPIVTTTYWVRIQNTTSPCTANTTGLTKIITVRQPSTAPTSITSPAVTICRGSSVLLTAAGGTLGTGANYQWGTGAVIGTNPIIGATAATYSVSPTSTTTYWVRVENTTSPCSAITGGVTTTITVNDPSTAPSSITSADICRGSAATLTANGGILGTGANYQWGTGAAVGVNPIAGETNPTLVISPTINTTYWVRIENGGAPCAINTSGLTRTIIVRVPSVAPASITAPSFTFCNSGTVTLTAAGGTLGTAANYQWGTGAVIGSNPIVGATGITLAVSALTTTTTYWVRIENTTAPCSAITGGVTTTVTINNSSVAPTSITGPDIPCGSTTTTLTANGATLGTNANYQWGTGAVVGTNPLPGETGPTLTVSPSSTTTYWVRVENTTAPCASNTTGITKVVTVNQSSVAAASASKNKNNICPGISVNLSVVGGFLGTNATWRWYTGSGSCGTTAVGTGATISVTPNVTTTYYVRAQGDCNTTTCVAVTVFISCDIDKDKDGIPDLVESNIAAAFAGSPVINAYNPAYAGFVDNNNDFINDNFQADGDSDNDGIPNYLDTDFAGRVDSNSDGVDDRFDADLDGIINMLDLDSDNDGIPDVVEAYGVDANGDGLIDNFADTDGDGLSQNVDVNNTGAYNTGLGLGRIDLDGDGYPNFVDVDSDNDGIPDIIEAGGTDANNNGRVDVFVDANNDGISDGYVGMVNALLRTGADGNNDGKADTYPFKNMDNDLRPDPYDIDSDGDGIGDVAENNMLDADLNGIVDGPIGSNGWSTSISGLGTLIIVNSDGDAKPDYLDIDSDNDGITDNIEGQTTFAYKVPTTVDTDGDGLANVYDQTPSGFGGAGIYPLDTDGDTIPDYLDLDTDSDGQIDRVEGNDFNFNKLPDDLVTLLNVDTDGDGLDDRFDNDNTSAKVTSAYMGANGAYSNPGVAGTRSVVQLSFVTQSNRDWRFVGNVLPVKFLKFSGVPQGSNVKLSWTIIADKAVDHFEIERSLDNVNYSKVGTVNDPVTLQQQQTFGSNDNISAINSEIIYYRLKVIGKSGEITYSNILVIRRTLVKTPLKIHPNPANDYVSISFFAEKDGEVMVRLIDNIGKLVLVEKQNVSKGNNTMQLNNLTKYSNGIYTLQVIVNGEIISEKLVLSK